MLALRTALSRPLLGQVCRQSLSRSYSRSLFHPSSVNSSGRKLPVEVSKRQLSSGSVDEAEMQRFQQWAKAWWLPDGEYEALHSMNDLRVPLITNTLANNNSAQLSSVSEPLLGLNVLDIGCGGGILSEPLARLGATVTGIDACRENILSAQLRAESQYEKTGGQCYERIRYINCTLEDLAEVEDNQEYFDAVVMSEVVEHVNNLDDFLANSSRLLKNGGFSFVTTINRTTASYLLAIVAAENVLGLVAKGTHTWDKFVTPDEVKLPLEKSNVFVKYQSGMCYNPVSKRWSWSDDTSVNYALYAQKQVHA